MDDSDFLQSFALSPSLQTASIQKQIALIDEALAASAPRIRCAAAQSYRLPLFLGGSGAKVSRPLAVEPHDCAAQIGARELGAP